MATELSAINEELVKRVVCILDPACPLEDRHVHQKVIDEFKDESPYCLQCGLSLAQETSVPTKAHLGLQLVEHFVRYRLNSLSKEEQVELQQQYMGMVVQHGGDPILPGYVREAQARVLVEMAKRTWPHLWSSFITDVLTLVKQPALLEVVLLIVRRLTEDLVSSYDNFLSPQRKTMMLSYLKNDLEQVFQLLNNVLSTGPETLQGIAISTMSALADWADLQYFVNDNCQLLVLLLQLLSSPKLQLASSDCLIDILTKRGDLRKSRPLREKFILLFSKEPLEAFQKTALEAHASGSEESYLFLKRICQVLVQLGVCQLAPLWDSEQFVAPESFYGYLTIMEKCFTQHPSQLMCYSTFDLWSAFSSHQHISRNDVFLSVLPSLLSTLRRKLPKVGDPSQDNHPSCVYSRLDFNGQTEHSVFFSKFKSTISVILTKLMQLVPLPSSEEVLLAVTTMTQQPPLDQPPQSEEIGGVKSLLALEWEGLVSFLDCWTASVCADPTSILFQQTIPTGTAVVNILLSFHPDNIESAAGHLRALHGGLQLFLPRQDQLLQRFLEKTLTYAVYPGVGTAKLSVSRDEKYVRLNALYCLSNMVKNHARVLLPLTEDLLKHYLDLLSSDLLLYSEICIFIEIFTVLSHFRPALEQEILIRKLLEDVHRLCSQDLRDNISSSEKLIAYLGLNKAPSDPLYINQLALHRNQLCFCVHATMSILQKCTPREMRQCGALCNGEKSTNTVIIPPSYQHVVPLVMHVILPLIRTFHQLWSDHSKSFLSPYFQGLLSLHRHETDSILGVVGHASFEQSELDKVHLQLLTAYDQCVMAVGFASIAYGLESLARDGFVDSLVQNVFGCLASTNCLRIKPVIRNLVPPMVISCPETHWDAVLQPVIAHTCYITYNCLQSNWSTIIPRLSQAQEEEQDATLSREVLLHQFIISLTREYAHLLELVCLKKEEDSGAKAASAQSHVQDEMTDVSLVHKDHGGRRNGMTISDLYRTLVKNETLCNILLLSVFAPLTWLDTQSARKCVTIAMFLFETELMVELCDDDVSQRLMEQALLALQTHGADEDVKAVLLGLTLQMYEALLPKFPSLSVMLASLPDCSMEKVKAFHQDVLEEKKRPPHIKGQRVFKWKKEKFKNLLAGIIGKPIGQTHRKPPVLLDLPILMVKKEHRAKKLRGNVETDLTALFDPDP